MVSTDPSCPVIGTIKRAVGERIWLDPLPGAQIENNEIVSLIDCEHSAAHSNFSGSDDAALFFLF